MKRIYNVENAKKMKDYEFRLKAGKRFADGTVKMKMTDLNEFDIYLNGIDFRSVNNKIADTYREQLKMKKRNENKLLLKTISGKLLSVTQFFIWLKKEDGYKVKIKESILDYFELSNTEKKTILTKRNLRKFPSLTDVVDLVDSIQGIREVDLRDRGAISLLMMTGIRDGTMINLQLKDFDAEEMMLTIDPETGGTPKGGIVQYIVIPAFDKDLLNHFLTWFNYLKNERKFSPKDPIFPKTDIKILPGTNIFSGEEVSSEFWKSTGSISAMVKRRSASAGLPYYSPHALRSSHYQHLNKLASSKYEEDAIWQNMGHEGPRTSAKHYGIQPIRERKDNLDNMINVTESNDLNLDDKFENFKKEVKEELKNGISKGFQEMIKHIKTDNGGDDKGKEK